MVRNPLTHNQKIRLHLIQWEFPVYEDGGESRVFRSRASPSRSQLRTLPVEARESTLHNRLRRTAAQLNSSHIFLDELD
jgi:hypothetical protein